MSSDQPGKWQLKRWQQLVHESKGKIASLEAALRQVQATMEYNQRVNGLARAVNRTNEAHHRKEMKAEMKAELQADMEEHDDADKRARDVLQRQIEQLTTVAHVLMDEFNALSVTPIDLGSDSSDEEGTSLDDEDEYALYKAVLLREGITDTKYPQLRRASTLPSGRRTTGLIL